VTAAFFDASLPRSFLVRTFTAIVERDPDTGLYVGFVPGFPGAHSQAESLDELRDNLREVIALLLEDGDPKLETEFVGVQTVAIA
jgi:predicted RNase H-like HicB family nuclease